MDDVQFNENFHMTKKCYNLLLIFLKSKPGCPINIKIKILIYLHFIGHVITYRRLRETFGIPHVTIFIFLIVTVNFIYFISRNEKNFQQAMNMKN